LAVGMAMLAHAQAGSPAANKVGIIHIQNAIISTKDGQKAAGDLQSRFAPKKAQIDKAQTEIAQLQDQLKKGSATLSDEARQNLMRDIDQKTKSLNRSTEDAQAELDQEQGKIMQELGQRMMAVIDKYAKDNGYSLILDVSSPQTPVLYAANGIDITKEIIDLYDKNSPGSVTTSKAAPAAASAPAPVAKPAAAAPAGKK
ncbi:MAG: OmpH family outer membrane protein, partial [Acidobacteria bacterium]|nr:OmpH family outer membrane protein [Acidobacteriota bacterium]